MMSTNEGYSNQRHHTPSYTIDKILAHHHQMAAGRSIAYASDWRQFPVSAIQYADLEERIAADESLCGWYDEKARWDYAQQLS